MHEDIKNSGMANPKEIIKAWDKYYLSCLGRPGIIDNMQGLPLKPPGLLRNTMLGANRLGNPACTFPIAYAYGDRDSMNSGWAENGAEAIMKLNN